MLPDYQLIDAIRSGSRAPFNDAVQRGGSICARDIDGRTTLDIAQACNRPDWGRLLISHVSDPNQPIGKEGDTLLHRCARVGDIGFTVVLLEAGADANVHGRAGQTPLHLASRASLEYLAAYLLDHHADPNAPNDRGSTPLHLAAGKGNLPMIKLLIDRGANPLITNNELYTPIHEAIVGGHIDATVTLIRHLNLDRQHPMTVSLIETLRYTAMLHRQSELVDALQVAETVQLPAPLPDTP